MPSTPQNDSSSSVITLTVFTFKSGSKLRDDIQLFKSQPRQVRELLTELSALTLLLQRLSETGDLGLDVDLAALRLTLEQCKQACDNVNAELLAYCSRSSLDHASFRDWLKLKCSSGGGIEGFRQQLIGYKSTVTVALTFANLDSIATSTIDLEAYLEDILQKLEALSPRVTGGLNPDATVRRYAASAEDQASFNKLQNEAKTLRRCLAFCSDVDAYVEAQISNIENHAEGHDTIQFMVSTDGRPINGKNHGIGKRQKQAGGHFGDTSLQQVSQDFKSIALYQSGHKEDANHSASIPGHDALVNPKSPFGDRHGPGFVLAKSSAPHDRHPEQ
ncbi:hypothetical protein DL764_010097 [Monosporascus ibericus]|uniref:Azaphilone pigments biosynthesis cluster protein L N-terminal domain-containing protein n=1 Tax=Monosporascus ibericus TaxID=155417 RepID=A0A4V1X8S8_9PEZI|nr:hypothetical protein DL764_010097 [Monosporascus ibericus]